MYPYQLFDRENYNVYVLKYLTLKYINECHFSRDYVTENTQTLKWNGKSMEELLICLGNCFEFKG